MTRVTSTSDKVNGAAEAPSPLSLSQLLEVLALSGRVRGPVDGPSTLGHDQLLELMARGGRVSLHVGDATSATTLHATATLPPVAPASSLSGVTAPPPSPSGGASGSGGAAVVAATAVAATIPVPPVRTKVMFADAFAAAASPPAEGSALPGTREPVVISDSESESEEEEQEAVQNEEEDNVAIDVPGRRWYVVTKGREVGVFAGWYATAPLVVSVSGACYARANSRSQAITDFAAALNAGLVSRIP